MKLFYQKFTVLALLIILSGFLSTNLNAQVLFNEGFNTVVPLPAGWGSLNNSTAGGTTGWFQGNAGVFPANSGATTAYIGANYNNTGNNGTISNWLFMPTITMKNGDIFTFYTRVPTGGGAFPDRLQVRMSTNGASTTVGVTETSVGDFSNLLLDINPTYSTTAYPEVWTQYTIIISGLAGPTSGRLAFRYFVEDAGLFGNNSNFIGIDDAVYTTFAAACSGTPAPGALASTANSVCPTLPFTLSLQTPLNVSGLSYQWQSSPDGIAWTDIPGATLNTLTTSQLVATYYRVNVTCGANTGSSNPIQINMNPPTSCYCDAGSPDVIFEKISNVKYNTINNSSTSTGPYENFTAVTTDVVQQSVTPITVTISTPFGTDKIRVWIDFNQDGDFADAGELVYTSAAGTGPHTGNITIPATSLLGLTRMRVRLFDSGFDPNPGPCGNTAYGQVEDYGVNITPCIPLAITAQPTNQTIQCGGNATFSLTATGSGPAYQWQERTTPAATWTNLSNSTTYGGVTTNALTISNAPVTMNGYQYRAVFSGYCRSTDVTSVATLTVNPYVATVSPTSATICNGSSQQLSITNTLGNVVALTEAFNGAIPPAGWAVKQNSVPLGPTGWYQGDNVNFFPANSGAANSYIAADYANTDPLGVGTISNWLMSPVLSIKNGDIITFYSRIPTGTEYPDRLEVRVSGNGASVNVGATETSVGDFTNLLLTINPTLVTGVYPKVWTQFTATVSGLPAATTGRFAFRYYVDNAGGNAPNGDYIGIDDVNYVSTGASATGVWTGPAGTMFTNAGLTTPYTGTAINTIYVNPTASTQYSVVVTTATPCVSNPTVIPVTVANPIGAVTDPASMAVCENGNATFTVSAASGNNIVYQWQESTDAGANWANIANAGIYSGATTATLTLTGIPVDHNNYQYRAMLSVSACSSTVTTAAATLTVNPTPVVTIVAAPTTQLYPGITTTLTANSTPAGATFQWYRDGVAVPGATGGTLVVDVDGLGSYTVSLTDVNGCAGTSATAVSITAAPNDIMFIYPSPTTGLFQVRYYSVPGNSSLPRSVTIFDSKGSRILTQTFNINVPYGKIEIDMTNHAKGVYRVELSDRSGNRIKTGSVLIL